MSTLRIMVILHRSSRPPGAQGDLAGVNPTIVTGEIHANMGPNGSGNHRRPMPRRSPDYGITCEAWLTISSSPR